MSSYSGPNEVTNGLVFQYDMGNTKKSWLGPPSVNLCLNDSDTLNGTNWYAYCAGNTNNITYNTADIKDPEGNYTATKIVRDSGTVCGATGAWGLIWGLANVTAGVTYTISIWACAPVPMSVWFAMNDAGGGGSINLTSTWQRFTFTSALPASGTGDRGLQFIMPAGSGTAYFWGAQLEEMSFMTPYMSTTNNQGSRTITTSLKDLTSINSITSSSLTYASDNTFSFNGTTDFITANIIGSSTGFTKEVFIKPTNITKDQMYFGYSTIAADYVRILGSKAFISVSTTGGQKSLTHSQTLQNNNFYHIVSTYDGVKLRIYVNNNVTEGVDINLPLNGWGIDRIGRWRDADQRAFVGDLYVARVYSRALSSDEVYENFNSLRSRFGL
jgi:hypothetical protein